MQGLIKNGVLIDEFSRGTSRIKTLIYDEPSAWTQSRLERREYLFSSTLKTFLAEKYRAELVGSWATGDAHLPFMTRSLIQSLSDVDIKTSQPSNDLLASAISKDVKKLAAQHGVLIEKVSVRDQNEIDSFWRPLKFYNTKYDQSFVGRFFVFWALVGVIEAISTLSNVQSSNRCKRSYLLVKFFFKICRNLLLINGFNENSYRGITKIIYNDYISHHAVILAYLVKIGRIETLSLTDCNIILSKDSWKLITHTLLDKCSINLLITLIGDMLFWFENGTLCNVDRHFETFKVLAQSTELHPAYMKAMREYDNSFLISE